MLFVVAAIAGCDEGDEGTIPKQSFVKRADAICVTGKKDRQAAFEAIGKKQQKAGVKPGDAAIEELVEAVLPSLAQMTNELEELKEPDTDAETATAMVSSFRRGVEQIKAKPTEVLTGPDPFFAANKQAMALKIKTCSEL